MTTTTASPSHTTQRQIAAVGAGTGLVAAAWTAYGADDWIEIALVAAGIAVTTALVFALVVPRALRGAERGGGVGGTALALSVPAVLLTLPAFCR